MSGPGLLSNISDRASPREAPHGEGSSGHELASNDGALTKSAFVGPTKRRLFRILGPGLITGASDDDPSGIATYSQAGAQFGFTITWILLFTCRSWPRSKSQRPHRSDHGTRYLGQYRPPLSQLDSAKHRGAATHRERHQYRRRPRGDGRRPAAASRRAEVTVVCIWLFLRAVAGVCPIFTLCRGTKVVHAIIIPLTSVPSSRSTSRGPRRPGAFLSRHSPPIHHSGPL